MNNKNNRELDLFERFFNGIIPWDTKPFASEHETPYEVAHTKDGSYLFYEVPGFNKSNLKVEMDEGFLYIEGLRTYKLNNEEKTKELSHKFKLGTKFNPKDVEVTIEDGLLTVFLPNFKVPEPPKRVSLLK